MIIGKMDRYIDLKAPVEASSSGTAGLTTTYPAATYSVWAFRVHRQSTELTEAAQLALKDTFEYRVRYYDAENLTAKYILVDGSDTFEIFGLKVIDRNEAWIITAVKKDNV